MVKKMSRKTAIDRILQVLAEDKLSSREISDKLDLPYATVRTTLSFLKQVNFVKAIPEEKRGKPFMLTEQGRKHLETLRKGKNE